MAQRETSIIAYYHQLDRSYFMDVNREFASCDHAIPIGYGQTISQPSLVLAMTLLLDLKPDSRVLEIGTGSGYQTALLAPFADAVYTVERIPQLQKRAIEKLHAKGYNNISFKLGDGSLGWQEYAPFDRIMVTAAASVVPDELIDQLAPLGKMVIPVGPVEVQELLLISKDLNNHVFKEVIEHVRFVRLVGKYE